MDELSTSHRIAASGAPHQTVTGPAVWRRTDLEDTARWTYRLTAEMIGEIDANLARLVGDDRPLSDLVAEDFPLPSMGGILDTISDDLGQGIGFALLSGLPIEKYSRDQAVLIFYGIGAHLGVGVSQSHLGDYIGDVIDQRDSKDLRPYHNGGEFIMHRDPVDMVGLLSMRQAKSGGESRVISAAAVHNEILAEAPELLEPLYHGFSCFRLEQDRGETEAWTPYNIPVFEFSEDGKFSAHYIPYPIDRLFKRDGTPPDSPEAQAIGRLKELLWTRPELYYDMMLEPGDMQFVNNRLLMHGRTDYEDWGEPERRRYLLRLWLQMPSWGPPPPNQLFYRNIDRAGGGIAKYP
ncbi:MAG: TauD/TfdA family dioxygenase [Proteobacteria bacterium]|nr:TauD/TfdA family dioxygenase [Pseudomonadota bacterium]